MNRDCFSAAIFSAFTFRFLVLVIQNADFNLEREHCHELTFRGVGGGGGGGGGGGSGGKVRPKAIHLLHLKRASVHMSTYYFTI